MILSSYCAKCCSCCCPPKKHDDYPKIIYSSVSQQEGHSSDQECTGGKQGAVHGPATKIFQFPLTFQELSPHPRLGDDEERFRKMAIIKEQPRKMRDMSRLNQKDEFTFGLGDLDEEDEGDDDDDEDDDEQAEACKLSIRSADDSEQMQGYSRSLTTSKPGDVDIGKILRTPELTLDRKCKTYRSMSRYRAARGNAEKDFTEALNLRLTQEISICRSLQSPRIHFSLYYDKQNSTLTVHLNKAVHLSTSFQEDSSNPFVMAYLLPGKNAIHQTPSIKGTHDPLFNYVFKFVGVDVEDVKQVLVIKLYINDVNHFIGGIIQELETADLFGNCIVREMSQFDELSSLGKTYQGDILVTLCFRAKTKILEILILEACNLRKEGTPGIPNPYIKLNLIYRGQRIVKLKTSRTKDRRTVNPVINEKCDILLSTMNMADIQVDIVMMSYDRFSHNHVIGSVSIGEMVSHESGQMHWNEVMRLKDTACSHWHALISTATTHPVQKAKSSIYQLSVM